MVSQIPLSRKSVPRNSTFASFVCAKIGLITVAVHGMCLTFMAQEASSRGESGILTSFGLAPVWLQVRVNEFAMS